MLLIRSFLEFLNHNSKTTQNKICERIFSLWFRNYEEWKRERSLEQSTRFMQAPIKTFANRGLNNLLQTISAVGIPLAATASGGTVLAN